MRTTVARSIAVGLMLAAGTLLSACSGQTSAVPATQTTTPATTSGTATAAAQSTSSRQSAVATGKPQQGTNTSSGDSVNCSANGGKVGPAGGKQVDLIAEATQTGTVGCTEAFNVISDYYRDAPTKAEGTAHVLVVQGWTCMTDTGAQGSGLIGCSKGGLALHTGQS